MTLRNIALIILLLWTCACAGDAVRPSLNRTGWVPPDGRSQSDWLLTHGMRPQDFYQLKNTVIQVKQALARKYNLTLPADEYDEFVGDILLTQEQAHQALEALRATNRTRRRRKVVPFDRYPGNKWTLFPIYYMFDGTQNSADQNTVRRAVAHWEEHTCVRFQEVTTGARMSTDYILFTNDNTGCWSYIGKVDRNPQQINLQSPVCTEVMGITVHELGHTLGLYHEQARPDRDLHVAVLTQNVEPGALSNFEQETTTTAATLGVPYDYGSVMHYSKNAFSRNGEDTVLTRDRLMQRVVGQRVKLSFFDTQLANKAYCEDSCSTVLQCERGGYPNPNACHTCVCPEGFGGTLCDTASPSTAGCDKAGVVQVTAEESCVESPAYDTGQPYPEGATCSWWLQAPVGCRVDAWFAGDFGLYCKHPGVDSACYHWVELKYAAGLTKRGPRFCCSDGLPLGGRALRSQTHEMLAVFDAPLAGTVASDRKGFRLCFRVSDPTCLTQTSRQVTTTEEPILTTSENYSPSTVEPSSSTTTTRSSTTPSLVTTAAPFVVQCGTWTPWSTCFNQGRLFLNCSQQYRARYCPRLHSNNCGWEIQKRSCKVCREETRNCALVYVTGACAFYVSGVTQSCCEDGATSGKTSVVQTQCLSADITQLLAST